MLPSQICLRLQNQVYHVISLLYTQTLSKCCLGTMHRSSLFIENLYPFVTPVLTITTASLMLGFFCLLQSFRHCLQVISIFQNILGASLQEVFGRNTKTLIFSLFSLLSAKDSGLRHSVYLGWERKAINFHSWWKQDAN